MAQQYTWAAHDSGYLNFGSYTNTISVHTRNIVADNQNYYYLEIVSGRNTNLNVCPIAHYNKANSRKGAFVFHQLLWDF
jgi:hypothetical protein